MIDGFILWGYLVISFGIISPHSEYKVVTIQDKAYVEDNGWLTEIYLK